MIDAILGAAIMVVATTSLVLSIELAEKAFSEAGRYPLNEEEIILLRKNTRLTGKQIELFWVSNVQNAPREWDL